MDKNNAVHWDVVHSSTAANELSWFQQDPSISLRLIQEFVSTTSRVLEVGAGTSNLVDSLLEIGFTDISLLDISAHAIDAVRRRLGQRPEVHFVTADVRTWQPTHRFDVWHDRAVFHFLVDPVHRAAYLDVASAYVEVGGVIILGTFAAKGPTQCSGLATARYDAAELAKIFGSAFALEHTEHEQHVTPSGALQEFTWVVMRRIER